MKIKMEYQFDGDDWKNYNSREINEDEKEDALITACKRAFKVDRVWISNFVQGIATVAKVISVKNDVNVKMIPIGRISSVEYFN